MELPLPKDDDEEELLVELHEQLLQSGSEIILSDDETLDDELRGAVDCLNLIERVRRQELRATLHEGRPFVLPTASDPARSYLGRYQLKYELGRGGAGVVWLAVDTKLDRQVALKVPHPHFIINDSLRQRFALEASVTARFNHPHIVKIHEFGSDGALIYFASEYCNGPNLGVWQAKQTEPVPTHVAAIIIRDLASAVQHAHSQAVIHRDIKPSNVLVVEERDEKGMKVPFVKLCDFSLAKLLEDDARQTQTGDLLGTPAYMSPEQAEGRNAEIDVRTDVYSLGALLFELLTGVPPFQGENRLAILSKVLRDDPPSVRGLRKTVPLDLAVIVARCLEKEPRRRFASAQELKEELDRFLDGRPILSRPVSPFERFRKWVKRKPMAAAFWAVVTLSLIGGVLGTVAYARRMSQEATRQAELNEQLTKTVAELEQSNRINLEQAYPSQIRRAYELIGSNHPELARIELDRLRPKDRMPDLRGWEWDFVDSLVDQSSKTLQLEGVLYACAMSPDKSILAAGGSQGIIWLKDLIKGTTHHWHGDQREINGLAFHPEGKQLASAGEDGTVKVWNVERGRLDYQLDRHDGEAYGVGFSHDGRYLASGGGDRRFRIYDTHSGKYALAPVDCPDSIEDLTWSPTELMLRAGLRSGGIYEAKWDGQSFQVRHGLVGKHGIKALRPTHDGKWFVAAGPDGRYGLFRSDDVETLWWSEYLDDSSRTLAISPNSQWIATAHRFNLEVESFPSTDHWIPHPSEVDKMAATHDGTLLATFGTDKQVRLWELPSRRLIASLGDRPLGDDGDLVFSPDGKWLVIASEYLEMVDIEKTRRESTSQDFVVERIKGPMEAAEFSPDSKRLYLAGWSDGHAEIIDFERLIASRGNDFPSVRKDCHKKVVTSISASPDGRYVATASADKSISVWDAELGERIASKECRATVYRVKFSPDSRWMAAGAVGGHVWLFDSMNQKFRKVNRFGGQTIRSITFSPDSTQLLINSQKWALSGDSFFQPNSPTGPPREANRWLPDGTTLFADQEGVLIAEAESVPMLPLRTRYQLRGHQGSIGAIAFSSDNSLWSAGHDGTLKEWRVNSLSNARELPLGWFRPGQMFDWNQQVNLVTSLGGNQEFTIARPASNAETVLHRFEEEVAVDLASDGTILVVASPGNLRWLSPSTMQENGTFPLPIDSSKRYHPTAIRISPKMNYVAIGFREGDVLVFKRSTGEAILRGRPHQASINVLAFSKDESLLGIGGTLGQVDACQLNGSGEFTSWSRHNTNAVLCLLFSDDNHLILSGCRAGEVHINRINDPTKLRASDSLSLIQPSAVHSIALSPDGKNLTVATEKDGIRLWRRGDRISSSMVPWTELFSITEGGSYQVGFRDDRSLWGVVEEEGRIWAKEWKVRPQSQ